MYEGMSLKLSHMCDYAGVFQSVRVCPEMETWIKLSFLLMKK